jgi:tryptophan synthase beta chain
VAIDEALSAKAEGRPRTILFNLSGHGHFDLAAYESYLAGKLEDFPYVPLKQPSDSKDLAEVAA